MLYRTTRRRLQTLSAAQSARAILACAVTAGLSFHVVAHPAKADETVTAEAYLAKLVNDLGTTTSEINNLELEMGGLREGVNKARVDLDSAKGRAQSAQNDVLDARNRLKDSDGAVGDAQKDLDELARSTYATGGDASPITLAAGTDSVASTLDRSSYLRMATERQQGKVNQLDLARTQAANEESTLRSNRNSADSAVADAVRLYNDARESMKNTQSQLRDKRGAYTALLSQKKLTEDKLAAARSAIDTLNIAKPGATSWDKRQAAEAAVDKVERGQSPSASHASAATSQAGQASQSGTSTQQTLQGQISASPSGASEAASPASKPQSGSPASAPHSGSAATPGAPAAAAHAGITPYAAHADGQSAGTTGSALPAGDVAGSVDQALPAINNVGTQFAASSEGDDQRQLAINGLLAAGGAAAMAGFTSYASHSDQQAALNAALQAGRTEAGNQFDRAQGRLRPQSNSSTSTAETSDNTGAGTSTNSGTQSGGISDGDASADTSGTVEQRIERVIERGMTQLGMPYAWGGGNHYGPTLGIRDGGVADTYGDYEKVGFDCSGLVMYAFAAVGIHLDHYSGTQYNSGRQVPVSEAKRGDLLFWGPGGSQHVAIYLGNGEMLEAPQSGSNVQVSPVRWGGMTPNAVRLIE